MSDLKQEKPQHDSDGEYLLVDPSVIRQRETIIEVVPESSRVSGNLFVSRAGFWKVRTHSGAITPLRYRLPPDKAGDASADMFSTI